MSKFDFDKALELMEVATKVGILGWSDKLSMGALGAIFKHVDKDAATKFINQDLSMWDGWSEERWETIRRIANKIKFEQVVTMENVMAILQKERLDLYVLFSFHPGGKAWLRKQLEELKEKLEES